MKKINVRFERDETLDHIDVVLRASEKDDEIDALMRRLTRDEPKKITVLDREGRSCVIDESDVITVSANSKQVRIMTENGFFDAKQSLQNMEELLHNRTFLRISRFELVNLKKIQKYDFTIAGTLRIEFEGGIETWASRRYISLIKEKLLKEEGYLC